jgi:hypothetical protein
LDRAERSIQQSWQEVVATYGTNFPVFYQKGSAWDTVNTENWMSLLEVKHPRLREFEFLSDTPVWGRQYEVQFGLVEYQGQTYVAGQKFYGIDADGTLSGGPAFLTQVGALVQARPGDVGRPCLIPSNLLFEQNQPLLAESGSLALPILVACQPWMIAAGFYTTQEDFSTPEYL